MPEAPTGLPGARRTPSGPSGTTPKMTVLAGDLNPLRPLPKVGFSTDLGWGQGRLVRVPEALPDLPGARTTPTGPSGTTPHNGTSAPGLKPFRPLPKVGFSTDLG